MDYLPLDPNEDEIRLLEVDCLEAQQHKLVPKVALRKGRQRFVALSYPWGDGQRKDAASVSIDGRLVKVSQNLHKAIQDLIKFWSRTHGRDGPHLLLWCDQICIDQSSDNEKNHQVSFMSEIYRRADLVLIWLPLAPRVSAGFDQWPKWKEWHMQRMRGTNFPKTPATAAVTTKVSGVDQISTLTAWENVMAVAESTWWSRAWVYQEFMLATTAVFLMDGVAVHWLELRDFLTVSFTNLPKYVHVFDSYIAAYERGIQDNWTRTNKLQSKQNELQDRIGKQDKSFRHRIRVWHQDRDKTLVRLARFGWPWSKIYSEAFGILYPRCLANDEILGLPWWPFAHLLSALVFVIAGVAFVTAVFAQALGYCITLPWKSDWTKAMQAQHDDLDSSVRGAVRQLTGFRQTLDRVMWHRRKLNDIGKSWEVAKFILYSKSDTANGSPVALSKLVKHARNCNCTDARDKIFAFLGLADAEYGILADYRSSNTLNNVLTEATVAIIKTERSLNILNDAREIDAHPSVVDHLPSWVPNFTRPDRYNAEYWRFIEGIRLPSDCHASGSYLPSVSFDEDRHGNPNRILKCMGKRICFLRSANPDSDYQKPWARFENGEGLTIDTSRAARVGDEVWVLMGADVPFCLSKPSARDPYYQLLGQAMLLVAEGNRSAVMNGSGAYSEMMFANGGEEVCLV